MTPIINRKKTSLKSIMVQKSDFCFWFMGTIGNAERSKHAALIRKTERVFYKLSLHDEFSENILW